MAQQPPQTAQQQPQMAQQPPQMPPGVPPRGQLYPTPVPGVRILPPREPVGPGQHIIGYELIPAKANCNCQGFSVMGVISMIILLLVFWPLFWVPLVIDDCFEQTQRPVYSSGPDGSAPPTGAVHQAPPYYQGQAPPYQGQGQAPPYQGQGGPPYQGQAPGYQDQGQAQPYKGQGQAPGYQGQGQAPNYQGQGAPPHQGPLPHQGPQAQGAGLSGVVQGEPAVGQPVHPGGADSSFPDPVKAPKTTA